MNTKHDGDQGSQPPPWSPSAFSVDTLVKSIVSSRMIEIDLTSQLFKNIIEHGTLRKEVTDWLMANCGPRLRKDHTGNYITSNSFKGWNLVMKPASNIEGPYRSRIRTPAKTVLQFINARHAILFKMKWG